MSGTASLLFLLSIVMMYLLLTGIFEAGIETSATSQLIQSIALQTASAFFCIELMKNYLNAVDIAEELDAVNVTVTDILKAVN